MQKPNFFIVGAPKCGTTSMHLYLSQHPEIFMPKAKEPHFFGGHRFSYPNTSWDKYFELFDGAKNEKRIGESSTGYLYSDQACNRIYQYDGNAKIIIMLRNPVNMIHAWHSELLWQCVEDENDFSIALALQDKRKSGLCMPQTKKVDEQDWRVFYYDCGKYAEYVKKYLETFGKDQVHIIIFEKFIKETETFYKKCLDFLDVDNNFVPQFIVANQNRYPRWWFFRRWVKTSDSLMKYIILRYIPQKYRRAMSRLTYYEKPRPPMPEDLRMELTEYFQNDIIKLERLTGMDFSIWKSF